PTMSNSNSMPTQSLPRPDPSIGTGTNADLNVRPSSKHGGGSRGPGRGDEERERDKEKERGEPSQDVGGTSKHSTGPHLEEQVKATSKRALHYESQMLDLNNKLTENLSNFRAIDSLLQEALAGLQLNANRADRALTHHVPHIQHELDDSLAALHELSATLPTIQARVADIRGVYDSGREKAQSLTSSLLWLNTDFPTRWRLIIFTPSAPVSWRWKAIMRTLFTVFLVFAAWVAYATLVLAWSALGGAYRAHRQRLVWGERLMV
ncbi:hypothetical protein BJ138DRAFT_1155013, partial [Hygrophoropsis aurantiaca]